MAGVRRGHPSSPAVRTDGEKTAKERLRGGYRHSTNSPRQTKVMSSGMKQGEKPAAGDSAQ